MGDKTKTAGSLEFPSPSDGRNRKKMILTMFSFEIDSLFDE